MAVTNHTVTAHLNNTSEVRNTGPEATTRRPPAIAPASLMPSTELTGASPIAYWEPPLPNSPIAAGFLPLSIV